MVPFLSAIALEDILSASHEKKKMSIEIIAIFEWQNLHKLQRTVTTDGSSIEVSIETIAESIDSK